MRNQRPRLLPWDFRGWSNYCDQRHAKEGGIYGSQADKAALHWRSIAEQFGDDSSEAEEARRAWNVRESVKYEWKPSSKCERVERFDGQKLCDSAAGGGADGPGQSILLLGDSLQEQYIRALVFNVAAHIPKPAPEAVEAFSLDECRPWLRLEPGKPMSHGCCSGFRMNPGICANLTFKFIRNDYLFLAHDTHKFDHLPWTRYEATYKARVVILNRGAHYTDDESYRRGVRGAVRHLRNHLPHSLIIYRSTAPGHKGCDDIHQPLKERQELSSLPYNWDKFPAQNEIAREEVEAVGGVYLDVDGITSLRGDAHQALIPELQRSDCLHYCFPSALDGWAMLLYNVLINFAV